MAPLEELTAAFDAARDDAGFHAEFDALLRDYSGRPTPLFYAARLTEHASGARVYLKREDLSHTGSHKINNALGQVLLARRMGKGRIIAETGAGQHGVATATVCALFGLKCVVYMGTEDMRRQSLNVFRMRLLGAEVREVDSGSRTLKDAINEALRDWVTNVSDTYYLLGSAQNSSMVAGRRVRRCSSVVSSFKCSKTSVAISSNSFRSRHGPYRGVSRAANFITTRGASSTHRRRTTRRSKRFN